MRTALALMWVGLGLILLLDGCGASAFDSARSVILRGADAENAVDPILAREYRNHAAVELDRASTIAEYRERISGWDDAIAANDAFRDALRTAESAVDTAEQVGSEAGLFPILGCLAKALRHLVQTLTDVGLDLPELLKTGVELFSQYSTCPSEALP